MLERLFSALPLLGRLASERFFVETQSLCPGERGRSALCTVVNISRDFYRPLSHPSSYSCRNPAFQTSLTTRSIRRLCSSQFILQRLSPLSDPSSCSRRNPAILSLRMQSIQRFHSCQYTMSCSSPLSHPSSCYLSKPSRSIREDAVNPAVLRGGGPDAPRLFEGLSPGRILHAAQR